MRVLFHYVRGTEYDRSRDSLLPDSRGSFDYARVDALRQHDLLVSRSGAGIDALHVLIHSRPPRQRRP